MLLAFSYILSCLQSIEPIIIFTHDPVSMTRMKCNEYVSLVICSSLVSILMNIQDSY